MIEDDIMTAYKHFKRTGSFEAVIRNVFEQNDQWHKKIKQRSEKSNEKPYFTRTEAKNRYKNETIDHLMQMEKIFRDNKFFRKDNSPGITHITSGLALGQMLGYDNETLKAYILHDYYEDIFPNIESLDQAIQNNAAEKTFKEYNIHDDLLIVTNIASNTIKQIHEEHEEKYGKGTAPQTTEGYKKLDELIEKIETKYLKTTLKEIKRHFQKIEEEGRFNEDYSLPPDEEQFGTRLRIRGTTPFYLKKLQEAIKKAPPEKANKLTGIKLIDATHNLYDDEHLDEKRRVRRLIKTKETIKMGIQNYEKLNEQNKFLLHTLQEMYLKRTEDIRGYLRFEDEDYGVDDIKKERYEEHLIPGLLKGRKEMQENINDYKTNQETKRFLNNRPLTYKRAA